MLCFGRCFASGEDAKDLQEEQRCKRQQEYVSGEKAKISQLRDQLFEDIILVGRAGERDFVDNVELGRNKSWDECLQRIASKGTDLFPEQIEPQTLEGEGFKLTLKVQDMFHLCVPQEERVRNIGVTKRTEQVEGPKGTVTRKKLNISCHIRETCALIIVECFSKPIVDAEVVNM